jgi:hypothetical protein
MSATNRRVRRAILEILWEGGPMTKEDVAVALGEKKGVNHIPSPHSLSALLCKSHSVITVGKRKVENILGHRSSHSLYDLDREVVLSKDEIKFIREPSTMTPTERRQAMKCVACGRTRVFPPNYEECLHCGRISV